MNSVVMIDVEGRHHPDAAQGRPVPSGDRPPAPCRLPAHRRACDGDRRGAGALRRRGEESPRPQARRRAQHRPPRARAGLRRRQDARRHRHRPAGLDIGNSIHISHVTLPDGTKSAIDDRDFTIATIVAPSAIKSEAAEAEAGSRRRAGRRGPRRRRRRRRRSLRDPSLADELDQFLFGVNRRRFRASVAPERCETGGSSRCRSGSALAIPARNMRCTGTTSASWRPTPSPKSHGFDPPQEGLRRLVAPGPDRRPQILLLKPATFMNESGRAVGEAMRFFKSRHRGRHRLPRRARPRAVQGQGEGRRRHRRP